MATGLPRAIKGAGKALLDGDARGFTYNAAGVYFGARTLLSAYGLAMRLTSPGGLAGATVAAGGGGGGRTGGGGGIRPSTLSGGVGPGQPPISNLFGA